MNRNLKDLSVTCPACGYVSPTNLGKLRVIKGIIYLPNPGNLYQCPICGLLFRRPYLSTSELAKAYGELSADLWPCSEDRADFRLAASVICHSVPSGCILDVGCYRGDFLAMLPDEYQKYGIEPAKSAHEIAQQRGITLLGCSIEDEDIEIDGPMFDVITLLDLIEHLPYPLTSLQRLVKLLLPGGLLILSTGNTNAIPWRLMRRDYWYYFSEHVSFVNPQWFRWAARSLSIELLSVKRFSHFKGSSFERWHQFAKCLAFWIVGQLDENSPGHRALCSIYPFNRLNQWLSPPITHLWRDHMLVVLKSLP